MQVAVRIVIHPTWVRGWKTLSDGIASAVARVRAFFAAVPGRIDASITPAAISALAIGLWRLAMDLGILEWFPVSSGFFSHWQAWIGLAVAIKFVGASLMTKLHHKMADPPEPV
jgi:hypothetical protein